MDEHNSGDVPLSGVRLTAVDRGGFRYTIHSIGDINTVTSKDLLSMKYWLSERTASPFLEMPTELSLYSQIRIKKKNVFNKMKIHNLFKPLLLGHSEHIEGEVLL